MAQLCEHLHNGTNGVSHCLAVRQSVVGKYFPFLILMGEHLEERGRIVDVGKGWVKAPGFANVTPDEPGGVARRASLVRDAHGKGCLHSAEIIGETFAFGGGTSVQHSGIGNLGLRACKKLASERT